MKWLENCNNSNNKTRSLLSILCDFVLDYFHCKYLLKLKVTNVLSQDKSLTKKWLDNTNLEKKKIRQLAKFLINPSSRSIQPVKVSRSLWIIKNSFNRSGSNFPDTLLKLEDIEFYDRRNVDVEVVPGGEKSSMPENWNLILNTVQNSARLLLKKERKKGRKKSRNRVESRFSMGVVSSIPAEKFETRTEKLAN